MLLIDILRGVLGMAVMVGVCYLFSKDRAFIDWRLVGTGIFLQLILAFLILKVPFLNALFDWIAKGFQQIIKFTDAGSGFLFGYLIQDLKLAEGLELSSLIAFKVLPTIIFFSALTAMLYYMGILQRVIFVFAWLMRRTMRLSGAESLAMAANIFIGQTEAPLVIKPYLPKMSQSEIFCLMTGGMATIAGSVFGIYVTFLGGDDPVKSQFFAKHLLIASIISAPAAIVAAKMIFPETEKKSVKDELSIKVDAGNNLLDAISIGTTDGLRLAVNVGAMLLVFTALVYMLNYFFIQGPGTWFHLNESVKISTGGRFDGFSFTYIISLIFAPVAWVLGTPNEDILVMGQLLGKKTVINEFVAYSDFNALRKAGIVLQDKTMIIATYALCGFANFASIGIQIGGIGAIAPNQRDTLTRLGLLSLVAGTVASLMTAIIAGVLVR
jgi:CNT family concentrative nucleoside transporter